MTDKLIIDGEHDMNYCEDSNCKHYGKKEQCEKTHCYYRCYSKLYKQLKILGNIGENSLEKMWELVVNTFEKHGYTKEDALRNARMARILRVDDYDFKKKEVKLWKE